MNADEIKAEFERNQIDQEFNEHADRAFLGCDITPKEWQEIRASQKQAFRDFATRSMGVREESTCEDLIIATIRFQGPSVAAKSFGKWLQHYLETGDAAFFERLAEAIRDSRDLSEEERQRRIMPATSCHNETAAGMILGWTDSLIKGIPPFALWTYDALTEFFENACKYEFGREGIRRIASTFKLQLASVAYVRRIEYSDDFEGFRLIKKIRKRQVKRHKGDKRGEEVSLESETGDTN